MAVGVVAAFGGAYDGYNNNNNMLLNVKSEKICEYVNFFWPSVARLKIFKNHGLNSHIFEQI